MMRLALVAAILPGAHGKGCFTKSAEVTMWDGSLRALQDVRIGDVVLSWDEDAQAFANSTVKGTPSFTRHSSDIVELELATDSERPLVDGKTKLLHATEDHPFWSRSKAALVSLRPEATATEYQLEASLLEAGEQLESPSSEGATRGAHVVGLRRAQDALALRSRRLEGMTNSTHVEVSTLCLHPHHWFYVQGVRVHNKGCFVESTEVSMAGGGRVQLQDVKVGDQVLSWDEVAGKTANSTVMAMPEFHKQAGDLVEIALPHVRLLSTEDHPFWSRGKQALVSAHPNATFAEYELRAQHLSAGEELESEDQQGVSVLEVNRHTAPSAVAFRRLANGPADIRVLTLCLEPHHWFYAHGVRVHNKGCFTKTAEVTMANRERKQIQDVQIGDEVLSWDEDAGRVVTSVVQNVPTFSRRSSEMVEIALPDARLLATEDHPLWSRSKEGLVSMHPDKTRKEYQLDAQLIEEGEELDGEHMQGVPVSAVRRAIPNASAAEAAVDLRGRRLDAAELPPNGTVEVMTLCLQPHHWFYVHGVRVHNKGCFAPWVRVLMSDGTQKPISSVRSDDRVVSWDSASGQLVDATVLGVETFPAGNLLEAVFGPEQQTAVVRRLRNASSDSAPDGPRLVFTDDHPVYSLRQQGLVSFNPNLTFARYGIPVGQMWSSGEVFVGHSGQSLNVSMQPWAAQPVDRVMTLRLDEYHWFYAEGVRVHNKGGAHGGHGAGVSFGSAAYRSPWSTRAGYAHPSAFGTHHNFVMFAILAHDRRRRHYWSNHDNDGCRYTQPADGAPDGAANATSSSTSDSPAEHAQQVCSARMGGQESTCFECDACADEECMKRVSGCEDFIAELYDGGCERVYDQGSIATWAFLGIGGCCFFFFGVAPVLQKCEAKEKLKKARQFREQLQPVNGEGLTEHSFSGNYTENEETQPTSYQLSFSPSGAVSGNAADDDGQAKVDGVMQWQPGATSGQIAWQEVGSQQVEASGSIQRDPSTRNIVIQASYVSGSNVGVTGTLHVVASGGTTGFGGAWGGFATNMAAPFLRGAE